jgi:TM2 domain-containing membrane protein YozV
MYSVFVAYFLWLISGFGCLGFHRYYLGKIGTGLLWTFTGGLCGLGSIYDLITLPWQVREANAHLAIWGTPYFRNSVHGAGPYAPSGGTRMADDGEARILHGYTKRKERPEYVILKVAKANKGVVTVSDLALAADITVDEAKKNLDALVSKGIAELRVRESGALAYVFPDFASKDEPFAV